MMNPTDNTENTALTCANHQLHEKSGKVEDEVIDRTSMKPIENLKEECLTKMVEGEAEDSDDAEIELMLTKLLPDAFSIWKEKYRSLVKEEYPEASKTTIEDKLREIWYQIPAEHQQKYYDKANAMIKRYRLSLGSCSFSKARKKRALKSHFKLRSKETTVLKPKPIKARRITSECADHDGWQSTEECAQEYKYDYSKAMRETMTYNSPDKTVKKKLAKMKVRDNIMDFTDENEIATGFLQDIMIASNIAESRSEYNSEDFVFNDGSLDVGELDSYLSGGDDVFGRCDNLGEEINLGNHQMKQRIDVREEKKRRNRMKQRERRKKKRKLLHALAKYCDIKEIRTCDIKEIRTEKDGEKKKDNSEELTEQYYEEAMGTTTCQDEGTTDEENKSTNDSPGIKANECITGKHDVAKETYDIISTNVHVSFNDNIHDGDEKIARRETCTNVDSGTPNLNQKGIQKEDYIDGKTLVKENRKNDSKDEIKDEVEEDRLEKEGEIEDFRNTTNGKEEQQISEEEGKEKMDEKEKIERKIKNVKKQKSSTRLRRTSKRILNLKQN
ncbi:uncharacterized protein LOC130646185 [Hydractinia symbiolongicarpus]|uniref:uncharacterized protein LOC130646185 n=1 Tax=Hydractinia symbiolongicarpus TaxID=13093 RepID=UPI00254D98B7|nr:uncharacterized protein LOC130646185 [Hydractinia symbiolongicarpus]